MQNKNIYIASDHAGFDLKTKLLKIFPKINDLGTKTDESVDYPDFAHKLTKEVLKNKKNVGILICGTGVGMSIAANRKKGIRAGLANNSKIARLIRKHNDANVLVLPGRFTEKFSQFFFTQSSKLLSVNTDIISSILP